jgi:hypothetical protein
VHDVLHQQQGATYHRYSQMTRYSLGMVRQCPTHTSPDLASCPLRSLIAELRNEAKQLTSEGNKYTFLIGSCLFREKWDSRDMIGFQKYHHVTWPIASAVLA